MINAEEARQKTILGKAKYQKKLYISTVKKINRKIKEATKKVHMEWLVSAIILVMMFVSC